MSQAREFVETVREKAPPPLTPWQRFRFDDGSVAEFHPRGWDGQGRASLGEPGDPWVVVIG